MRQRNDSTNSGTRSIRLESQRSLLRLKARGDGRLACIWDTAAKKRVAASIRYHYATHGEGQGILQYTRDAVDFLARNGLNAKMITLKTGEEGIKISAERYFGSFTRLRKIVSYGPK